MGVQLPSTPNELASHLAQLMEPVKHCEHCLYWAGQDGQYMGDCLCDDTYQSWTPFDYGCASWALSPVVKK